MKSKFNSDKVAVDCIDIAVYNEHGASTRDLDGQFVHSQLLIDCLLRMAPADTDKDELVAVCMKKLKGDPEEVRIIREFKSTYLSNQAVRWYTRDTFLYRMLNKALRTQDIDLIFLFRFFIRDIQKLLQKNQCLDKCRVYRGQWMATIELDRLRNSIGKLISVNSFFSTSKSKKRALAFIDDENDLPAVLFEIDISSRAPESRPVGDISKISYYEIEQEILFMLGSIFRVQHIAEKSSEDYWTITLTLCSDHDQHVKGIIDNMKNEYSGADGETDLLSFGVILCESSQFDKAEHYFRRLLGALPSGHNNIGRCYFNLGVVADRKGDYDTSLRWYQKWLRLKKGILKQNDSEVGDVYICIGSVRDKKGDRKGALESFNKALEIFKEACGNDSSQVAMCFNNIGNIHQTQGKYTTALECHKKALAIHQRHHIANHPHLGLTCNNIGIDYQGLGQYELALRHLNQSYEIKMQCLPPDHPDIARTLASIGHVFMDQKKFQNALVYFEKAATIFKKRFSSDHPCVMQVEEDIRNVQSHVFD